MNNILLRVPVSITLDGKAMFKFSGVDALSKLMVGSLTNTDRELIFGLLYSSRLSQRLVRSIK